MKVLKPWNVLFDEVTLPPNTVVTLSKEAGADFRADRLVVVSGDKDADVTLHSWFISDENQLRDQRVARPLSELMDREIEVAWSPAARCITLQIGNHSSVNKTVQLELRGHTVDPPDHFAMVHCYLTDNRAPVSIFAALDAIRCGK